MASKSKLFQPLKVGNMNLKHRLIMAPLTRFRADDNHVPIVSLVKDYYEQRASVPGTLIVTEASYICPPATGMPSAPGLWAKEQLLAWKEIVDAIHAKGSYVYVQLWALGRAAYAEAMKSKGLDVVSSSAVPFSKDSATPRELREEEILQFIKDYAEAARGAVEIAGFDGVEIHGANGYLIDQFTQDTCNKRTDKWGGSIEKRARFGLEVTKAVVDAVGADRVGIRLSPFSTFQGMRMEDPYPQFSYLVKGLKDYKLAYLHLVESRIQGNSEAEPSGDLGFAVDIWNNQSPVFVAGGFKPNTAIEEVDETYPDKDIAVVFGRYFISNPDLPFRIEKGIELTPYDRSTFYNARSPKGYIDYPFSKEWKENEARL